jgi:hypothetical protein
MADVPYASDLPDRDLSSFWKLAHQLKDRGLQRGTIWRVLVADDKYKNIIHAKGYTPTDISSRLCKDLYAQVNAQSHITFDAQSFVEAGELMQQQGGGFFRYGLVSRSSPPFLTILYLSSSVTCHPL